MLGVIVDYPLPVIDCEHDAGDSVVGRWVITLIVDGGDSCCWCYDLRFDSPVVVDLRLVIVEPRTPGVDPRTRYTTHVAGWVVPFGYVPRLATVRPDLRFSCYRIYGYLYVRFGLPHAIPVATRYTTPIAVVTLRFVSRPSALRRSR